MSEKETEQGGIDEDNINTLALINVYILIKICIDVKVKLDYIQLNEEWWHDLIICLHICIDEINIPVYVFKLLHEMIIVKL